MTGTGRKRASRAEREQQIMDAALRVFEKNGFEKSTTKAIAAEAGVSEGTLFIYFKTKRDILISAMRREIIDPLPELLMQGSISDEEIVRGLIANRLEMIRNHSGIIRLMLAEGLTNRDLQREFFLRIFTPGSSVAIEYLSRRMNDGAFRQMDPTTVVRMLISTIVGYGLARQIFNEDPADPVDSAMVDTISAVFLDGIRA